MTNPLKIIARKLASSLLGVELVSNRSFGKYILRDAMTIASRDAIRVVFDIGANQGEATAEFANVFKKANLYSFEPDPATFRQLEKRFASFPRVKLFPFGLGRVEESRELAINKGSGGNSFLSVSPSIQDFAQGDWTVPVGKVQSRIRTLDDVCEELGIEKIDLIKIDTQGFELEVIHGGSKMIMPGRTALIYVEVLFVELYKGQCFFEEVFSLLTARGFRFVGFYNPFHKTEPPHYLLWCDALFVAEGQFS